MPRISESSLLTLRRFNASGRYFGILCLLSNASPAIGFSGSMSSFYELLKILSDWLVKKKLKRKEAQKYITSLYSSLAELAVVHSKKNLKYFVTESQTPGGLNWQGLNQLRKAGYFKSLEKTINNILKRLNKV